MLEVAIGYVGAYLARKAMGILNRAGSDADSIIDRKLSELYDWVKGKLTGSGAAAASLQLLERDPEGDQQQALATDQLERILSADPEASKQLQLLVDELNRLRPPGVSIKGLAEAKDVAGEQIGVDIEGPMTGISEVIGEAKTEILRPGARNIGVRKTTMSNNIGGSGDHTNDGTVKQPPALSQGGESL